VVSHLTCKSFLSSVTQILFATCCLPQIFPLIIPLIVLEWKIWVCVIRSWIFQLIMNHRLPRPLLPEMSLSRRLVIRVRRLLFIHISQKNQSSLIASDVYCSKLYGSTPANFDSTITQIQDLSEDPNQKYHAHFTDFLSSWAQPSISPSSEIPIPPKPFQIYPPSQPIRLHPDKPNLSSFEPNPNFMDITPIPPSLQTSELNPTSTVHPFTDTSSFTVNPYSRTYHKVPKSSA